MKKLKYIAPIIINGIICLAYKIYTREVLRHKMDGDILLYIDGRIEYNFSIGSVSMTVLLVILFITILWILWNAKHCFEDRAQKSYKWISIALVLVVDGLWMKHYYDWYLSGLPEYIIRPALENLL